MSFIQSRIRCDGCQKEMNVAFGIVGTSIIAQWPTECPDCKGSAFTKIADDWKFDQVAALPPAPQERP